MSLIPEVSLHAVSLLTPEWMSRTTLLLLYVGPDQLLPLTSVLGAIAGVLLMFWNRVLGLVRTITRILPRRGAAKPPGQET